VVRIVVSKKHTLICILVTLAVLFLAGAGMFATQQSAETPECLISLGDRFLLEQNYEQALVKFLRVIEIEPMNPRGYTGAAEAYLGLGQLYEAVAILQLGLERTGADEIRDMLNMLISELALDESDDMPDRIDLDYYESNSDLTEDQRALIHELVYALLNENYITAAEIVNSNIYQQLVVMSEDEGRLIYQYMQTNIAIFPHGRVYIGDLYDGLRIGDGLWFRGRVDSLIYICYVGQWENDMPNGYGILFIHSDEGSVREYRGTFQDGLFHGLFLNLWRGQNRCCDNSAIPLTYVLGVLQLDMSEMRHRDGRDLYLSGSCESCGALIFSEPNQSNVRRVFGF